MAGLPAMGQYNTVMIPRKQKDKWRAAVHDLSCACKDCRREDCPKRMARWMHADQIEQLRKINAALVRIAKALEKPAAPPTPPYATKLEGFEPKVSGE